MQIHRVTSVQNQLLQATSRERCALWKGAISQWELSPPGNYRSSRLRDGRVVRFLAGLGYRLCLRAACGDY
jgi:hypothetical protein